MIVMTIEVKQLLIKSSVSQRQCAENLVTDPERDPEEMKSEILEECRQLFIELLREQRER